MPKHIFWPATLVTMGLIFLASNMGYLPVAFWNLWPIILIVVGLGGLLTSDRTEWMTSPSQRRTTSAPTSSRKKKTQKKAKK